ncbi:hypothetical protein FA13DRAFT_1702826 [Coprinellus micaceus]|uniref:Uncharacterized protein n=1 Tax=Coprinellus micaceus TaxID=71717 RepID=A0A4Y7RJE1_COPMI|nr:hypothetical protein FA13DRAFT_1702826 [Coprinellus micaceus]
MSFLLVRWLGAEPGYQFGFDKARLPKVGFVPYADDGDNFAFGFLDPSQVLRGCHLIPDFRSGCTSELLPHPCAVARQLDGNTNDDWETFYMNIFVDRDMVMHYYGGGISHLDTLEVQDSDGASNDEARSSEGEDEGGSDSEEQSMVSPAVPATAGTSGSDEDSDNEPILEDEDEVSTFGSEESDDAGDDDDDGRYASD